MAMVKQFTLNGVHMKKLVLVLLTLTILPTAQFVMAAQEEAPAMEAAAAEPVSEAPTPAETAAPAVAEPPAPVEETEPVPAPPALTPTEEPAVAPENLEFVSGEVSTVDEAAKTVTVKLYGETETDANDKILTISLDEATDITDGEKDRDLKSLTAGTEVDVEYDPTTSKATYIFVY